MARDRERPGWFLPPWMHRLIRKRGKAARLRAIHGDLCWLCGHPMRFGGPPNRGKAATIEHVVPLSRGGTGAMDNLRLCHVGCNRHLGDRTAEQKEKMRINRERRRPA